MPELDQFVILARGQRGRGLDALIQQVLNDRKCFVFGELLDLESVQGLEGGEYSKTLRTLELFAYGTYEDYSMSKDTYIELTDAQVYKLKQLSIVSMAQDSRILHYADLMTKLSMSSTRDLEQLIIDTVYAGVVKGRLNQREQLLRVMDYIGRDVPPGGMSAVRDRLSVFQHQISQLIETFQSSSNSVATQRQEDGDAAIAMAAKVKEIKQCIKEDISGMGRGSSYHDMRF
jgi:COP9 signalosome complex subunit 7